jgi:hypothetical protein
MIARRGGVARRELQVGKGQARREVVGGVLEPRFESRPTASAIADLPLCQRELAGEDRRRPLLERRPEGADRLSRPARQQREAAVELQDRWVVRRRDCHLR